MATFPFRITEHKIPCQHIREYPHATAHSQETPFHLAIKQYTPLANPNTPLGAITIIAAQANAMPKETYEPLWEDLLSHCEQLGLRIRNIWIADMAHQGASAVHNEEWMGNEPHWFDHSRDLLHMINCFRDDMSRPIVGIGHSVGAAQLVFLSLMHPRLLTSLVLIEPWLTDAALSGLRYRLCDPDDTKAPGGVHDILT
jgi:pimeloyl-ACP methyl ester carboxylesterase